MWKSEVLWMGSGEVLVVCLVKCGCEGSDDEGPLADRPGRWS